MTDNALEYVNGRILAQALTEDGRPSRRADPALAPPDQRQDGTVQPAPQTQWPYQRIYTSTAAHTARLGRWLPEELVAARQAATTELLQPPISMLAHEVAPDVHTTLNNLHSEDKQRPRPR